MLSNLEKRSRLFWTAAVACLILVVSLLDVLTGSELSFPLFYLLPVTTATWFLGKRLGFLTSVIATAAWFLADVYSGRPSSNPLIPYLSAFIRLGFLFFFSSILSALRRAFEHEKELARVDSLTGAVNVRFFYELLAMEMERYHRNKRPFTVAFLDMDNFKMVNDRYGHSVGDHVLSIIVKEVKGNLRKIDVLARLGGDEFALLLPDTGHESAQMVLQRMNELLQVEMRKNGWPITFSMGAITCQDAVPQTPEELINQADALMYTVKNSGKNAIAYSMFQK